MTGRVQRLMSFLLFESVDDLLNAHTIMEQLYTNPVYSQHLAQREKANNHARLL
jgi:phosphoenolpyruvate carboxylase